MRTDGSKTGQQLLGAMAALAALAVCAPVTAQDKQSPIPASIAAAADAGSAPSLVTDPAWMTDPKTLDVAVGNDLQLQLVVPGKSQPSQFAATAGIWRPVDSVTLRAGYGIGQSQNNAPNWTDCEGLNCAKTNLQSLPTTESYTVGASWRVRNGLSLNLDYLNRQTEIDSTSKLPWITSASGHLSRYGDMGLTNAEALDISLTCDIDAGSWGDLELGLQVSRVVSGTADLTLTPNEDEPITSAAVGLGWQKGGFRGDITSRYLDVINQSEQATGWTAFDVNFAWRMPWNASVSVGARNVLNSPAPVTDNLSDAEVENFFGRVPYVRYQQDL